MKLSVTLLLLSATYLAPNIAKAENFEGTWVIDIRTTEQKKNNVECGMASFVLTQNGTNILGTHDFYTPYCGRLNEGGQVIGEAKGSNAILFVTSGRNGAIVKGKAELKNGHLHWVTLEELKPGEPEGDSPLILSNGILNREKPLPSQ